MVLNPNTGGVYAISVAAELVGTGQQNLRLYERRGLLEPGRTEGGTRRYSEDDLVTLRRIAELLGQGLNLSGIRLVLTLENENQSLRSQLLDRAADPGATPRQTRNKTDATEPR
ncbi:MerR family transcriptional regulator [Arthrobacter dokdonensis]|uniref:MerR family transcriptional regulator n=1 Tax=Arthrobacter dokdonellae TaxID=2211210 RepID=UPI001D131F42|nr:MerR family transcriptional regulator [Arthrobacter dokdonellae]